MDHRESPRSGVISVAPHDVMLLKRAEHDLLALRQADRALIALQIDALATNAAPRGALALHGRGREHVRYRVGRFRLLYKVRGKALIVVAINGGPV